MRRRQFTLWRRQYTKSPRKRQHRRDGRGQVAAKRAEAGWVGARISACHTAPE